MAFFYKYEYTNKTKNIHPWASAHFVRCQNFPEFFLLHLQLLGNASVLWCSNQPSLRLMGKIALFTSPCFTSAQRIFLQQVHEF